MSAINRVSLLFTTYGGVATKVLVCVAAAVIDPSGAAVTAIRDAINIVSTALGYKASLGVKAPITDTPANGDYEDVEDKMVLTFLDSNGIAHSFGFPSPLATNFLSTNNDTVNPADTNVAALISGMLTNAKTAGGGSLASYKGGTRIRKKNKRT